MVNKIADIKIFQTQNNRDNIYCLMDILDKLDKEILIEMLGNLEGDYIREILIDYYKHEI